MSQQTSSTSTGKYLDARITTASQPELQLILIEGALRFGRLAMPMLGEAGHAIEADTHLARAMDIVEELVHSVAGGSAEAAKRLEEEYAFAFRELAVARLGRDAAALQRVLNLLNYQRETWQLACEKLKAPAVATGPRAAGPHAGLRKLEGFSGGPGSLSLQA